MRSYLALIVCLSSLLVPRAPAQTDAREKPRPERAVLEIKSRPVDADEASKILMDTMSMEEIGTEMVEPAEVKAAASAPRAVAENVESDAGDHDATRYAGLALMIGGLALGAGAVSLLRNRP